MKCGVICDHPEALLRGIVGSGPGSEVWLVCGVVLLLLAVLVAFADFRVEVQIEDE